MNIVNDKMPQFKRSLYTVLNDAFREASRDILIKAKNKAPFDKGGLRAESDAKSITPLHWRISFWKEYARYQELGGDKNRVIKNYTTGGTGKNFLKNSGDQEALKLKMIIKKHASRARP